MWTSNAVRSSGFSASEDQRAEHTSIIGQSVRLDIRFYFRFAPYKAEVGGLKPPAPTERTTGVG
jgi:hypothetical protein